jgi:hypothetical protein
LGRWRTIGPPAREFNSRVSPAALASAGMVMSAEWTGFSSLWTDADRLRTDHHAKCPQISQAKALSQFAFPALRTLWTGIRECKRAGFLPPRPPAARRGIRRAFEISSFFLMCGGTLGFMAMHQPPYGTKWSQ